MPSLELENCRIVPSSVVTAGSPLHACAVEHRLRVDGLQHVESGDGALLRHRLDLMPFCDAVLDRG